ncbi:MAG: Ig-like domain-containing protein [Cytophagaceae bacterium]
MTKTLSKIVLLLWLAMGTSVSYGQFKVVGYHPSWAGSASAIQYSKLTHINYAFALPLSNGSLKPIDNPAMLQQIVANAHAAGKKVFIAIGGWSDGGTPLDPTFEALAASATSRATFVNAAMNLVSTYNLDGVDIDWEYPDAGASSNNFAALMQQLSASLHAQGKGLSAAIAADSYSGGGIPASVFGYVDHLNVMAYDNGSEANHSSYNFAQSAINYWIGRGCPKDKLILGVPFYARPSWNGFNVLVANGANPNSDQFGSDYYNGIPTIQSKTQLAWNSAGGIMIWELSQDATGANSLLSAIDTKVKALGGTPPANVNPTISITSPGNGASFTAPASINISANASDADGSISKVEFYNGSTLLSTKTAAPYSYNWTGVAAGSYTITAKAYDNSTGTASASVSITVNVVSANQNPTITLSSPGNGSSFTAPASININASASDADGSISKVEFYNGNTLLATKTAAPYTYSWTGISAGSYTILAKAYDNSTGTASASASITVNPASGGSCTAPAWNVAAAYNGGATVSYNNHTYQAKWWTQGNQPDQNVGSGLPWNDLGACSGGTNQNPTVSLTSPGNGNTFTAPATVTISANASDADGSISRVEFYNGSTLLATKTAAPYSYSWTGVAAGSYTVVAKAYDNSTGTASASATITVNGVAVNQNPAVSLTSPSNGANFTAPATISISATASDADGSISKVEFYNGSTLLATITAAPYSYSWAGVAAGSYSITAKAYDNTTGTASAIASITVKAAGGNCTAAAWSAAGIYTPPMTVSYNGHTYQAKWWTQGEQPDTHTGVGLSWQDLGACGSARYAAISTVNTETEKVSPNPASDVQSVELSVESLMEAEQSLSIFSSSGSLLRSENVSLQSGFNKLNIDISQLQEGMYILKIGQKAFKFIKL